MADSRRYRALLIGNATHPRDPHGLPELHGPRTDILLLKQALTDTQVGLFDPAEVEALPDRTVQDLRERVDDLFTTATRGDVLLLYYSGHGRLDERGTLYLCAKDTSTARLRATALSAIEINNIIDGSPATTTVVILDCCYSGSFKGTTPVIAPAAGRGHYVLTSARSTDLTRAADGPDRPSPFTELLVRALCTAPHGKDADHLTVLELYRQVHDWMTENTTSAPQLKFEGEGDVALARRPARAPAAAAAAPDETEEAAETLTGASVPVPVPVPEGAGPSAASPATTAAPAPASPPAAHSKAAHPSRSAEPKGRAGRDGASAQTQMRVARAGRGATVLAAVMTVCVSALLPTKPPATVAQPMTGDIVAVRCRPGDHFVNSYRDWVHDRTDGAAVFGGVCEDFVTTGYYWSVEFEDTAADNKCAHAEASWQPDKGRAYADYGMYVCGYEKTDHTFTPVRSSTQYGQTKLGAFIDAGSVRYGASYGLQRN